MRKILFVTSEAHPLMKTGGLGDVSGALPIALKDAGDDVRIIMPAYRESMKRAESLKIIGQDMEGLPPTVRLLESRLPGSSVTVYMIDSPTHFDRGGGPYTGSDGRDWPDNAERFAIFARTVVAVAMDRTGLDWKPDIVHCNDWQSGLVPPLLGRLKSRPAIVFTIHNLAYQGLFPWLTFKKLGLSSDLWSPAGLEFFGRLSFIKGGLVFADALSTVSPTYAEEIRTPQFGYGLEGLLNARSDCLFGILNGADYSVWDPRHDPYIAKKYGPDSISKKRSNKTALQKSFGLPVDEQVPVIGTVGRLVEQKGIDLLIEIVPQVLALNAQIVILGTGEERYEMALTDAANHHPDQLAVHIGYNEGLAHEIESGADIFVMPSRFEPCGLNQIYSLRYGTVPVVHQTGGLADTVVHVTNRTIQQDSGTGFVFSPAQPSALLGALETALRRFKEPEVWSRIMAAGMRQDFSWRRSAERYLELYQHAEKLRNLAADSE